MSIGTPTKQASSPSAVACAGSRIIVPGPPKRGISLPPSGWFRVVMAVGPPPSTLRRQDSPDLASWVAELGPGHGIPCRPGRRPARALLDVIGRRSLACRRAGFPAVLQLSHCYGVIFWDLGFVRAIPGNSFVQIAGANRVLGLGFGCAPGGVSFVRQAGWPGRRVCFVIFLLALDRNVRVVADIQRACRRETFLLCPFRRSPVKRRPARTLALQLRPRTVRGYGRAAEGRRWRSGTIRF